MYVHKCVTLYGTLACSDTRWYHVFQQSVCCVYLCFLMFFELPSLVILLTSGHDMLHQLLITSCMFNILVSSCNIFVFKSGYDMNEKCVC